MKFERDTTFVLKGDNTAAPAVADMRGNGHPDIIMGGAGGGLTWFVNR
jgi:hypothetical protein